VDNFVIVRGVFVIVRGVFVIVRGVFVIVRGVFVIVRTSKKTFKNRISKGFPACCLARAREKFKDLNIKHTVRTLHFRHKSGFALVCFFALRF
jgi:hypothetical protein